MFQAGLCLVRGVSSSTVDINLLKIRSKGAQMPNFEDHFQNKYTAIGKMEHRGPPIPDRDLEFALAALQQQRVRLKKGWGSFDQNN